MAVLIEGMNVIVRNSTIRDRYPGGIAQYRRDRPNDSFCSDGLVTRVGFSARPDIQAFVQRLQKQGLTLFRRGCFLDIAIIDEHRGTRAPCYWMSFGKHSQGVSFVYLAGSDPNKLLAVPNGWSLESAERQWSGKPGYDEGGVELLFLRRDGSSDVFLNRQTGREVRLERGEANHAARVLN